MKVLSLSGAAEVTTTFGFSHKAWTLSQGGIPSSSLPLQGTDTERNLINAFYRQNVFPCSPRELTGRVNTK